MAATGMDHLPVLLATTSTTTALPLSNSSAVIEKGNTISIKVNQRAFQDLLNLCKFSLIATLFLAKSTHLGS